MKREKQRIKSKFFKGFSIQNSSYLTISLENRLTKINIITLFVTSSDFRSMRKSYREAILLDLLIQILPNEFLNINSYPPTKAQNEIHQIHVVQIL